PWRCCSGASGSSWKSYEQGVHARGRRAPRRFRGRRRGEPDPAGLQELPHARGLEAHARRARVAREDRAPQRDERRVVGGEAGRPLGKRRLPIRQEAAARDRPAHPLPHQAHRSRRGGGPGHARGYRPGLLRRDSHLLQRGRRGEHGAHRGHRRDRSRPPLRELDLAHRPRAHQGAGGRQREPAHARRRRRAGDPRGALRGDPHGALRPLAQPMEPQLEMRRLARFVLALAALAAALPACAVSYLWEVTSLTNRVYLFGTVHAGMASWYPLPRAVEDAFEDSPVLVVEADITDPDLLQKRARATIYTPPANLSTHVPPEDFARFKRLLPRYRLPLDQVIQMKPFMAASLLVFSEW